MRGGALIAIGPARRLAAVLAAGLALGVAQAAAVPVEDEVAARIERLRAIPDPSDRKSIAEQQRLRDDAWNYFAVHKRAALPALRRELAREQAKPKPDALVRLDLAFYLHGNGEAADREAARRVLFALDPAAPRLRASQGELLRFLHAVAAEGDARALDMAARHYLRHEVAIWLPAMGSRIDQTLACVFVFGAYGRDAEARLRALLGERAVADTVIEILIWLGGPESNAAVERAMLASPGYDTFARAATFLIRAGGPDGRRRLLAIDPQRFDDNARKYYARIRPAVESASFDTMGRQFSHRDDGPRGALGNSPHAILGSARPREALLEELARARHQELQQVSDEALLRVKVINALANTLRYRER